jgi:hypothetical protein
VQLVKWPDIGLDPSTILGKPVNGKFVGIPPDHVPVLDFIIFYRDRQMNALVGEDRLADLSIQREVSLGKINVHEFTRFNRDS